MSTFKSIHHECLCEGGNNVCLHMPVYRKRQPWDVGEIFPTLLYIYIVNIFLKKNIHIFVIGKIKRKFQVARKHKERNSHDVDNSLFFTLKCSPLEGSSPDYGGNAQLFLMCLYFPYPLLSQQSLSLETINPPQDIDYPLDLGKEEEWTTSSHP